MQLQTSDWQSAIEAWKAFTQAHPELGYRSGKWQFHNFLRHHRDALMAVDAIRMAKRRFWIAHAVRFAPAAFDCATLPYNTTPASASPLQEASGVETAIRTVVVCPLPPVSESGRF